MFAITRFAPFTVRTKNFEPDFLSNPSKLDRVVLLTCLATAGFVVRRRAALVAVGLAALCLLGFFVLFAVALIVVGFLTRPRCWAATLEASSVKARVRRGSKYRIGVRMSNLELTVGALQTDYRWSRVIAVRGAQQRLSALLPGREVVDAIPCGTLDEQS